MRYLVVVPISHNGQRIPDGAVVEDGAAYGARVKSPLPVARLLSRGRLAPIAAAPEAPAAPPQADPNSTDPAPTEKPAPTAAAAPEAPAEKRKKIL